MLRPVLNPCGWYASVNTSSDVRVRAITSFNSPLNMVAHKVAPALASGNTVVFKPPVATPMSATRLFELLLEAGLPPGHANLLQGGGADVGQQMIEHPGFDFFTFTGSTPVGKKIRAARGMGHVALELGSIAATIVMEDADLFSLRFPLEP